MRSAITAALTAAVAVAGCDSSTSGSGPSACAVRTLAYADADRDGRGSGAGVELEECRVDPPAGYAATDGDCDDRDATRWELKSLHLDADRDGHGGAEVSVCLGDALPAGYVASAGDCDDADAARFRGFVRYPDADGDGVGTSPRDVPCIGETLPGGGPLPGAGWSVFGWDPDDAAASVTEEPEEDDPFRPLAVR
jgi:hypothetical protein